MSFFRLGFNSVIFLLLNLINHQKIPYCLIFIGIMEIIFSLNNFIYMIFRKKFSKLLYDFASIRYDFLQMLHKAPLILNLINFLSLTKPNRFCPSAEYIRISHHYQNLQLIKNLTNMCGRIFQTLPLMRLLQIARSKKCTNQQMHTSSYNVCPTTYIPVIKSNRFYSQEPKEGDHEEMNVDDDSKELTFMKWGHQSKYNMVINGRIEELLSKRMFVDMIQNRCVVIMQGYFEWNQKKEPFCLRPKEGDHFLVAGLYSENNEIVILTKDATPQLAHVHSRMPVILSHEEVSLWMNPKNTKQIQSIIHKSLLKKDKEVWKNVGAARISPNVNNIKDKSVKCLMTYDDYKKQLDKTGLMRFWKKPPVLQAVEAPPGLVKSDLNPENTKKQPQKHDFSKQNICQQVSQPKIVEQMQQKPQQSLINQKEQKQQQDKKLE